MRGLVFGALGLALAPAFVACGGSEATETTAVVEEPLAGAAQETLDAPTAAAELRFEGVDATGSDLMTFRGSVDFPRHLVELRSGGERTILTENAVYLAQPGSSNGTWERHGLDEGPTPELPSDVLYGRLDPVRQLAFVGQGADAFEEIGSEVVRGEETVVYRGSVPTEVLVATVPPAQREAVRSGAGSLVLVDVWVDATGKVRRILYDFPSGDVVLGRRATIDLFDFGSGARIDVPRGNAIVGGGTG